MFQHRLISPALMRTFWFCFPTSQSCFFAVTAGKGSHSHRIWLNFHSMAEGNLLQCSLIFRGQRPNKTSRDSKKAQFNESIVLWRPKHQKDLCYEALHRCYNLFPHKDGIVIHFSHILCEKSVERLTVQLMFPSLSVAAGQPSSHKRDATFPTKFHRSADVNDMRKDKPTRCTHTRAHLFHLPKPAARFIKPHNFTSLWKSFQHLMTSLSLISWSKVELVLVDALLWQVWNYSYHYWSASKAHT